MGQRHPDLVPRSCSPIERALRVRGVQLSRYTDDWLTWAAFHQTAARHAQEAVALLTSLGIQVNEAESALTPTR